VKNAAVVEVTERFAQAHAQSCGFANAERAALREVLPQMRASDGLGDDVEAPVGLAARQRSLDDPRVYEFLTLVRLVKKASVEVDVFAERGSAELDEYVVGAGAGTKYFGGCAVSQLLEHLKGCHGLNVTHPAHSPLGRMKA
jgi:hypothetical protein